MNLTKIGLKSSCFKKQLLIMMPLSNKQLLFLLYFSLFCSESYYSQTSGGGSPFCAGNRIHFNARYIDTACSVYISERIILEITDDKWVFQRKTQNSINYYFNTDSSEYKNYVDPVDLFRKMDLKYYKKKKRYRYQFSETTGMRFNDSSVYFHPPRVNQYRMLFYAPHPFFWFGSLEEKHDNFYYNHIIIPGMGKFIHYYQVDFLEGVKIDSINLNVWEFSVDSRLEAKNDYFESERTKYDCKLKGQFCGEYGFIFLHYKFNNGISIEFDLDHIEKK